ncbi:hypothetical protein AVEN_109136-1 [Araneus ventricosus]|uniref:Uncharacterized protein n=1 Tax=Araneus ventricosus TaxID=182803 RepID=A0A4Y2KIJ0_ARAVE|nr:hypothetical protein AVEN_109136-1 [Araneus ventricosus]
MEAPCKRHSRSLQSPSATMPTPPPAFKTGSPSTLFRESYTPHPPFCSFRFCERGSLSLTRDRISVLWPNAPNENPNISTTPPKFSSEFGIDDGFWNNRL